MLTRIKLCRCAFNAHQFRFKSTFTPQSSEYQYLEQSVLPTDLFQRSLPRLPIPNLKKTCERYLLNIRPLLNDDQFNKTKEYTQKFEEGLGAILNQELLANDKMNKHTSYITQPWFDMYLESRKPLVLNYNPFLGWKDDPNPAYNATPVRVTNTLISALRFHHSLTQNLLTPEVFHLNPNKTDTESYRKTMKYMPRSIAWYASALLYKAYPLDMSQFPNLFASTRVPYLGKDEIQSFENSRHVIFIKGGQFFSLNVLDQNGDIRSADELYTCIKSICDRSLPNQKNASITAFSADERDHWATIRKKLISLDSKNKEHLHEIDSALFVICLDDVEFDQDMIGHAHNFLHGNNTRQSDPGQRLNRWFDKSLSLIFSKDGHAAVNFEHSWGDGVAVLRLFNEVFNDSTKNHFVHTNTSINRDINAYDEVRHLDFIFDNEIKTAAIESERNWHKRTSQLDLNYFLYEEMNRDYFKKAKVSPDSMFQLAFQLGYYKLFKKTVPTYESCSTSAFKHGRTETVRACTIETKRACETILSNKPVDRSELRQLLDDCSKRHGQLTKEAATGHGSDRHLFALRLQHLKNHSSLPLPDIFQDPNFSYVNEFILSTSTLYGNAFSGGGFGPVLPNGYGLAYGYVDNNLGVLCSSYKGQSEGAQLVDAIRESLVEIKRILN